ncbi:MAG: hypothetical protein QXU20_00545 [Candidatus Woesearchaeota archaeon]
MEKRKIIKMNLQSIIIQLESLGISDVLLPFILIFTIVFAILFKTKLFNKNVNVMLSLVMSLTTIIPHVLNKYPPCWDIVEIINNSMPKIALLIVGIISFFLILGVIGINLFFLERFIGWIVIFIFGFVMYTFLTSGGEGCNKQYFNFLSIPFIKYFLPIIIFILIVWFITKEPESSEDYDIY